MLLQALSFAFLLTTTCYRTGVSRRATAHGGSAVDAIVVGADVVVTFLLTVDVVAVVAVVAVVVVVMFVLLLQFML